jgi:rubrerythrin
MGAMEDLQAAFAGESQANRKYLAFAKKADEEGHPQIAKLFRATAQAETVHALSHFDVMGGVKDTSANLKTAIDGEGYEFKEMYPKFVADAEKEKNEPALATFKHALAVEMIHHGLYTGALNALNSGKDLPKAPIFVCGVCGNTVLSAAPAICPVCGAPRTKFSEVK